MSPTNLKQAWWKWFALLQPQLTILPSKWPLRVGVGSNAGQFLSGISTWWVAWKVLWCYPSVVKWSHTPWLSKTRLDDNSWHCFHLNYPLSILVPELAPQICWLFGSNDAGCRTNLTDSCSTWWLLHDSWAMIGREYSVVKLFPYL